MILNNTPTHEAVLSNVGEIGEFRIRNSAKAFSILSSGLYANKIRAIIRELSCNAVDSHVGADNSEIPFDVHLPTDLEPWFSIRDYGVGLSHDQVTRIYTTYFESTKTGSNDFIGALGLGSKSPFSYTDNFTVTAVQGGVRGIYSAFINGDGVPSIALMTTDTTNEPNGVEVKFSVNDRWDYSKFRDEAKQVYQYFAVRPAFNFDLAIPTPEYLTRDIIPGVHEYNTPKNYYRGHGSVAIMGNIAYPIEVPNASTVLGNLAPLLSCGLEIHFGIGELDFQASREGLSYIPQTIAAIKSKLEALNAALAGRLAQEVESNQNLWERAQLLYARSSNALWGAAVKKYVTDTDFPLIKVGAHTAFTELEFVDRDLWDKYNLSLKSFGARIGNGGKLVCYDRNPAILTMKSDSGMIHVHGHKIAAYKDSVFIINDTKKGAVARAKHHFRETSKTANNTTVYVLEPRDRKLPVDTAGFLTAVMNPPTVVKASSLLEKERVSVSKDVTILQLQRRDNGYRYNSSDLVWRDAGKSGSFDATGTFYYIPLSGFEMTTNYKWQYSASHLGKLLKEVDIGNLNTITVYGVRKADIEQIKTKKNWVNLEDHIADVLKKNAVLVSATVLSKKLDQYEFAKYNSYTRSILSDITDKTGKYATVLSRTAVKFVDMYDISGLQMLIRAYAEGLNDKIMIEADELKRACDECYSYYPLLEMLEHSFGRTSFDGSKFADYINSVDEQKKNEQI